MRSSQMNYETMNPKKTAGLETDSDTIMDSASKHGDDESINYD
jgi:hypothetical protein